MEIINYEESSKLKIKECMPPFRAGVVLENVGCMLVDGTSNIFAFPL